MSILASPDRRRAFRVGSVREQDPGSARLRVDFPDLDGITSWWLPLVTARTRDDKAYWMPDVGEQVVCLMDEHDEAGVVLGAIYSKVDGTPVASAEKLHLSFKDGASFEYDRAAHLLNINFQDGAILQYDAAQHQLSIATAGTVTLDASVGVTLSSGNSRVEVAPGGVSVVPPLATSSTVAQT